MKTYEIGLPSIEEQKKMAKLLSFLDERIATQNKIIDKLQSLIKGIAQNIVRNNKPTVRLSECLECKSSTLQESDVCEQVTYPVYGANGIVGYLDNYNTEGEAVYIIKDGSGVGTVSYVKGKCSATGTLNTLQAKEGYSLQYLYYLLKVFNFEPYKVFCRFGQEHLAFLTLEVRPSNTAAVALYEKHGFQEAGRRKNYYEAPQEDALLLTKEFRHDPA